MRLILLLISIFTTLKADYTYNVAAVLMFQNEARHLKEWIEYHKLIGVEHFYLYNNLSRDEFYPILEPYILKGEVEFFDYPTETFTQQEHHALQCEIYNHALKCAKKKVKWLAFIDGDEYIVPVQHTSISQELKPFESFGGVYAHWVNFGTSHVEKIPEDHLRIEILLHSEVTPATLGKSVVRPERVEICMDPHVFHYKAPYYHVNTNFKRFDWVAPPSAKRFEIYHYYTGDLDHLIHVKFPRRAKWVGLDLETYIQDLEGLNARYNPRMLRYVPTLKEKLSYASRK